jgi:hypothetical protein
MVEIIFPIRQEHIQAIVGMRADFVSVHLGKKGDKKATPRFAGQPSSSLP